MTCKKALIAAALTVSILNSPPAGAATDPFCKRALELRFEFPESRGYWPIMGYPLEVVVLTNHEQSRVLTRDLRHLSIDGFHASRLGQHSGIMAGPSRMWPGVDLVFVRTDVHLDDGGSWANFVQVFCGVVGKHEGTIVSWSLADAERRIVDGLSTAILDDELLFVPVAISSPAGPDVDWSDFGDGTQPEK